MYTHTHTHTRMHIQGVCVYLLAQLCPTLCDPMDCNSPGSSVHGDSPGKNIEVLEWVAMSSSRESSQPRDQTQVSHIAGRFFTICATQGSPWTLEWVAYSFSRGSFWPRNWTGVSCKAGRFFTSWATRETQISCTCPKWLKADAKQRLVYKCS